MILLIDNYDSFSYNLYQLTASIRSDVQVIRNDVLSLREIAAMAPDRIILSPGPGYPNDAVLCEEVVQHLGQRIPIMGVCLGHQAICEAFGMEIVHARKLMHGKQSKILLDPTSPLFIGMREEIQGARYHSLIAKKETLPDCLRIIATDPEYGEIMAVQHRQFPIFGVQFHPESILTPDGRQILENFLHISLKLSGN